MSDFAVRAANPPPRSVVILLVAVVGIGFAAAQVVSPVLWWTTAAMTALVLLGWRQMPKHQDADADPVELPTRTQRVVSETFAEVRNEEALRLLRGVIRPARTLCAAAEANESLSGQLLRDCSELVEVSCATAAELGRIDLLLAREGSASKAVDSSSVRLALTSSRDLFQRRLVDAGDALSKLYVQSVERGTVSSDRVAELAAELSAEVSVRKRVSEEMQALLE